jgi:hypothetical protein
MHYLLLPRLYPKTQGMSYSGDGALDLKAL